VHALYLFSVWLHILAASAWLGGTFFVTFVVVPWLRRGGREHAGIFLRETGERFRVVGWTCFSVLLLTGSFNLWARGVRLADFVRPEWLSSPFGKTIVSKLCAVALVFVVSGCHDFVLGPRAARALELDRESPAAAKLRQFARVLGRVNALLALAIVALAVILVRG
jgi:uncharacterized membrane protein